MIEDSEIERVHESKFLGVITDDKLSWKLHIHNVKAKMQILQCKNCNNALSEKYLESELTLYCLLIIPYITYCVELFGNTYKTNTNPIFTLQRTAMRIENLVLSTNQRTFN